MPEPSFCNSDKGDKALYFQIFNGKENVSICI